MADARVESTLDPSTPGADAPAERVLRPHAEQYYADELTALARVDDRPRPPGWRRSPWAVVRYVMGGTLDDGTVIVPKYVGQQRLVEVAVATLATDRALLLLGVPGTAKTWVSEHLAAAISGDSTLLVQGTAGTTEETLRYGWNYAQLLADGPSERALVPGPVYRGMRRGALVRVEELTRMAPEVQDALVTVLSEKVLPIPELDDEVAAVRGSTSSPPPTTVTAASTRCRARCGGASTRSSCHYPRRSTRRSTSSAAGSPSSATRSDSPRSLRPTRRSAASSPCFASCAVAPPSTSASR